MSDLILFDLPSKGRCFCWSLNPWKTRLVLNFKNIEYKTTWVEYPDIEATLSPHVPPNPEGQTPYTIPAVKFPDGTYIMDSQPIAERIERDYPSPPLPIDHAVIKEVEDVMGKIMFELRPNWMPLVPANILNQPSSQYFSRTREARIGKPLPRFHKEQGGEEAWVAAMPHIKLLEELLKKNGGPFIIGKTASYADFYIIGLLQFFKVTGDGLYLRLIKIAPLLGNLHTAAKAWLERDGH